MPLDPTVFSRLRGLALNASEVKKLTKWGGSMTEDYLDAIDNIINIAKLLDSSFATSQDAEELAYFYGQVM